MKPDLDRFLAVAAAHLMTRTAPALPAGYEQSSAAALGAMLIALGEEVERAAGRRADENRVLRDLFASAAPALADQDLAARLREVSAGSDPGLAISELEPANAALRTLLIELHAHVETLDTPAAREVEAAIWAELRASTERRKLAMAPF